MSTDKKQSGFTIIEVVLVLAIAALIFLMIFIALPALQRGQRDNARKQDANTVASALNSYRGNKRGSLPNQTQFSSFKDDYVKTLGQYEVSKVQGGPTYSEPDINTIQVQLGKACPAEGESDGAGKTSTRAAAVYIKLEANDAVVCVDA